MNKGLLLAGGTILVAGGLAYWYLSQQQGNGVKKTCWRCNGTVPESRQFPSGTICGKGAAEVYPYSAAPDCTNPQVPCTQGLNLDCSLGWGGIKRCDRWGNLCQCQNGIWVPLELDSYVCEQGIKHLDCFVNEDSQAVCFNTFESGTDLCEENTCYHCPCGNGVECQSYAHCASDNVCIKKAIGETVTQGCEGASAEAPSLEHWCYKWLDEPFAAQQIVTGSIYYKWAAIYDNIKYAVDLYYDGTWTRVIEGDHWNFIGGEGVIGPLSKFFDTPKSISGIAVGVNSGVSNVHIKNWGMTFTW